jgi:hypothetical protein
VESGVKGLSSFPRQANARHAGQLGMSYVLGVGSWRARIGQSGAASAAMITCGIGITRRQALTEWLSTHRIEIIGIATLCFGKQQHTLALARSHQVKTLKPCEFLALEQ